MTIDTSRFELRVALPDGVHSAIGIWDKQKGIFLPDKWCYSLESAERALRSAVKENPPKLVWNETGGGAKWREIQTFNHNTKTFESNHITRMQEIDIGNVEKSLGKQIRILELVEKQYVCEFEK